MKKQIGKEDIEHLCMLAQLDLTPEEYQIAMGEIQQILDYVEKLEDLNTDGVEPLCQIQTKENVFREDIVTGTDRREELLSGAPSRKDGYFRVPRTVE